MDRKKLLVAVLLASLAATVAAGAAARTSAAAHLRLVHVRPLVIDGTGFRARERVRVVLRQSTAEMSTRETRATTAGSFSVTFTGVTLGRCGNFSVIAAGSAGSRATLHVPLPACMPA
jgi:hypothetical protein